MKKKETIAQKALRLLSAVPEHHWTTRVFTNRMNCCCAIGHMERLTTGDPENYDRVLCDGPLSEGGKLRDASEEFIKKAHNSYASIASVNNEPGINGYTESEIKPRVIHLLKDMVKAGY